MDPESIEAWVKFQALLDGIGRWTPEEPDLQTIEFTNAWMGPHWIFVPQPGGIAIIRGNQLVYGGPLRDLPTSESWFDQAVGNISAGPERREMIHTWADDLAAVLMASIPRTPDDLPRVQAHVSTFFSGIFEQGTLTPAVDHVRSAIIAPRRSTGGGFIGRGGIISAHVVDGDHVLVITYGGACLAHKNSARPLWTIDWPAECGDVSLRTAILAM